ncbi:MAG: thermonuclease family protein [Verrucomicrobia bacterium]|nr:thermonuclease family protein [Verrucomicrobiota bacterium]
MFRVLVISSLFLAFGVVGALADRETESLENCRFLQSEYYDGDSFHALHKGKKYIFRLYFVDTPETDTTLDERIKNQAAYWGIRESDIPRYGKDAARFLADKLKGKSFTVHTRWVDAQGASRYKRNFAFVETDEGYLSDMIVEAGLARVYGARAPRPDGKDANAVFQHLVELERKAKKHKRGAWGGKLALPDTPAKPKYSSELGGDVISSPDTIPIFSLIDPTKQVRFLRKGEHVGLRGEGTDPSMVRVRFESTTGDRFYEAQCRRTDLGIQ